MPARSVCLVTLSLSEAGPGRVGRQVSVTDIYHTIPYHSIYTTTGYRGNRQPGPDSALFFASERYSGGQPRVANFLAE